MPPPSHRHATSIAPAPSTPRYSPTPTLRVPATALLRATLRRTTPSPTLRTPRACVPLHKPRRPTPTPPWCRWSVCNRVPPTVDTKEAAHAIVGGRAGTAVVSLVGVHVRRHTPPHGQPLRPRRFGLAGQCGFPPSSHATAPDTARMPLHTLDPAQTPPPLPYLFTPAQHVTY